MKAPIFIVGANRSGTTLLRLILNAHSRIAIPDEMIYFQSTMAGVPVEQWHRPGLSQEAYARFVDHFLKDNCELLNELDLGQLKQKLLGHGPIDLRRPYQAALEGWARYYGKRRWGEKTPGNLFYADIILEMFPDARFIYMVRDPRAGVCSMMSFTFLPDDVVFNALNRLKHMTVGRFTLEQNVPPAQRMTIRYEDLVTKPISIVKAVCAFLNETYEPEMLSYYQEASRYMDPLAIADFNKAAIKPITVASMDKWKTTLSREEIAIIERICAPEMREFGYESENYRLDWQSWLDVGIKKAYWRLQLWRNRTIRHYTVQHEMFARLQWRLGRFKALFSLKM